MRRRRIIWTMFFLVAVSATQISPSPYGDENDGEAYACSLPCEFAIPIEGRQTEI
jgi:hypothetical protein